MLSINHDFKKEELDLLKEKKGRKLVALRFISSTQNEAFGRVRLCFDNGDLDLVCTEHYAELDDGTADEDEVLSIEVSTVDLKAFAETQDDEMVLPIDKQVDGILYARNTVDISKNGKPWWQYQTAQALMLDLGDEKICIDKRTCNWVMLFVSRGTEFADMIYDTSNDWEDNPTDMPGVHNEFKQELVEL